MSSKDIKLIYETYSNPEDGFHIENKVVYEAIDQFITTLEGHGIVSRPKFNTDELYKLLMKHKRSDDDRKPTRRHQPDDDQGTNHDKQREKDERELRLMRAMQKFGHGTDYSSPFEETDHSKDDPALAPGDKRQEDGSVIDKDGKVVYKPKPKVAKEGSKGTQSDREKADVDDNGTIEPWEKKKANAIRKSQGKPHLCAKTVNHESFGTGRTIHARHAHPDVNGNIEWYVCEFKHGTEVINTSDLDIVTIVEHNHH